MELNCDWINKYLESDTQINWEQDGNSIAKKLTNVGIESIYCPSNLTTWLDVEVTPNRADCSSIYGILREIVATNPEKNYKIKDINDVIKETKEFKDKLEYALDIDIQAKKAIKYCAVVINNIDLNIDENKRKEFEENITKHLERIRDTDYSGQNEIERILHYVADVTGQPLNVYANNEQIKNIVIKYYDGPEQQASVKIPCKKSEFKSQSDDFQNTQSWGEYHYVFPDKNITISKEKNLLSVCNKDDKENIPLSIAGAVSINTLITATKQDNTGKLKYINKYNIILESAYFDPSIVNHSSKECDITTTKSSYLFTRGVDPKIQKNALRYAAALITYYFSGLVSKIFTNETQEYKTQFNNPIEIKLNHDKVNKKLGTKITNNEQIEILEKLGFKISVFDNNTSLVQVPSYRFDIKADYDLVEEIARIYSYDNIPSILPLTRCSFINKKNHQQNNINKYKLQLITLGYIEVINYPFMEKDKIISTEPNKLVELKNPIANWNVMRSSLVASLFNNMIYNIKQGNKTGKLFEIAKTFINTINDNGLPTQILKLAGICFDDDNFYKIKNNLLVLINNPKCKFETCSDIHYLHPKKTANIKIEDKVIGYIGQIHPSLILQYNIKNLEPYFFELSIDDFLNNNNEQDVISNMLQTQKGLKESRNAKTMRTLSFFIDKDNTSIDSIIPFINNSQWNFIDGRTVVHESRLSITEYIHPDRKNQINAAIDMQCYNLGDEIINKTIEGFKYALKMRFINNNIYFFEEDNK